jgi:hypothetical protein
LVGSQVKVYTSISAGITPFWSTLQWWSNRYNRNVEEIKADGMGYLQNTLRYKDKPVFAYGFWIEFIKNFDPRARTSKKSRRRCFSSLGNQRPDSEN